MKKVLKIVGLVLASLLAVVVTLAFYNDIKPIAFGIHKPVFESKGTALGGYDVVSYFIGDPVQGTDAYSFQWMETTWKFSSRENLETFKSNPHKFVPQFGGYCTKAVSTGFTAPGDPTLYTVWNDKLFIFSSEDVKAEFKNDPEAIITACANNWN